MREGRLENPMSLNSSLVCGQLVFVLVTHYCDNIIDFVIKHNETF